MSERNTNAAAVDLRAADASVDVLVIGAGGCGLVAALAAAEAGAEVAVVEKLDRLQGNTMLSSGSIPAAGTRLQREAGVTDHADWLFEDLVRVAGAHDATHIARRLADISAQVVEWLIDIVGVELTLVTGYRHVGHRVHRLHAPPSRRGADLMDDLFRAIELRGIPVAFGNPAVELVDDGEGGVRGAVTRAGSERVVIDASSVVLATNGFGANRALLAQYCSEVARARYGGATASEGEALTWGCARGAALGNIGAYQAHASLADPHGSLVTWTIVEKGGIVVDRSGHRFGDEMLGYSAFATLELQRDAPFYMIYDAAIRDATAAGQREFAELREHGGCVEADDLSSLAQRMGIDERGLQQTIEEAARAARDSSPDRFGRRSWGLGPLRPPLVATRIEPALFHTQGGLLVDSDARVLRAQGQAIRGLYAGGGAACGISGLAGSDGYCSGNGLLGALGLGWLAGQTAAREAVRKRV